MTRFVSIFQTSGGSHRYRHHFSAVRKIFCFGILIWFFSEESQYLSKTRFCSAFLQPVCLPTHPCYSSVEVISTGNCCRHLHLTKVSPSGGGYVDAGIHPPQSDNNHNTITTIPSSPWNATLFASTKVWGKQPLLLRGAFLKDAQTKDSAFPSWRDIIDLACTGNDDEDYLDDEPTIPSRLIAITRPGQIDSFELLGFGPFESRRYLDRQLASGKDTASTLVVNDVDRWIPDLSQWMDDNFASLIPRWRRDDAQISLANQGGGIGPHVDSYDVFLIQLSGTRTWELGVNYRVSVKEEFENLIEACSENGVRILNMTNVLSKESATAGQTRTTVKIQVEPGDCLYLPPRVAHWGTATSEKCMTLSVGCRAPSAADLIARLSETIILDAATASSLERVHQRYTEKDVGSMDSLPSSSFLSPDVKKTMKDLILEAVNQVLDDEDAVLDPLIGKIVTEPNRFAGDLSSYPVPLYDLDKASKTELGLWGNAESALEEVLVNGRGSFKRAEGVAFAWSYIEREGSYRTYRMYAHGRDAVEFVVSIAGEEHENAVGQLMDRIANGLPLNRSFLESIGMDSAANELHSFLLELINEGLLYGTDE